MKHFLRVLAATAVAILAMAVPSSAATVLDTKVGSQTVSKRFCSTGIATGKKGVVTRRVAVRRFSVVGARLTGARGDWDVAVFNARSRKLVTGSSGFNAREFATSFARRGTLIVQACRRSGSRSANLTVTLLPVPKSTPVTTRLLKVHTGSQYERSRLAALGLDVTEHAGRDYVEVVAYGDKDMDLLRREGFTWDVAVSDLNLLSRQIAAANRRYARRTRVSPLPSGRDDYRRLVDYEEDLKRLAEENPGLVRPFTLPNTTVEGREVHGVEIASEVNAVHDGRPVFAIMGVHHAREWPSGEHALEFAHELVNGSRGGDPRITDLLGRTRTVVVPIVNVDGFNVSREHLGAEDNPNQGLQDTLADPPGEYRRRNCRLVPEAPSGEGACMLPAFRTLGTDPNRNYGGLWGGPGASALPVYDTYRGSGPFSEPETQNIQWLVSTRQVTTLITNHTFSNLILRAPGVKAQGLPVDEERMKALGDRMAEQNGYTSQPGWALYDTTGTTEDWSYNATGGFGYTFEIGPNHFHPPYPEMISEYVGAGAYAGKGNRQAYLIALENTANTANHSVLHGRAAPGTVLRIAKEFETETSSVRPFETDILGCEPTGLTGTETGVDSFTDSLESTLQVGADGRFSWHVNPSTRPYVQEHRHVILEDIRSQEWVREPNPEDPSFPAASVHDHELVVSPEDAKADVLAISLDWDPGTGTTPEDYDLEIYRTNGSDNEDDWSDAGSAGEAPGCAEYTELSDLKVDTYVLRVVNFAAATQQYQLKATFKREAGLTTEPAKSGPEAWKFYCETPEGELISQRDVVIGRGEQADLGDVCGNAPALPAGTGEGGGGGGGGPGGSQGVLGIRASGGKVRISRRTVRLTRTGYARVRVYCPRTAKAPCTGILKLRTVKRDRTKSGQKRRFVKLGSAAFAVSPGRIGVVKVKVNRAARRLIARRRGGVAVLASVVARDLQGNAIAVNRRIRVTR